MKYRLTVDTEEWGPYQQASVESDHYLLDGTVYPFTVIGSGWVLDQVADDYAWPKTQEQIDYEQSVAEHQARQKQQAEDKSAMQADNTLRALMTSSFAEIDQHIEDNVTDLTTAKLHMKRITKVLSMVAIELFDEQEEV